MTAFIYLLISVFTALPFESESKVEWLGPTTHEFGDIYHKEGATHRFEYRNVSDTPIIIDNARPSCGCTIPTWSKAPVLPDSTGVLEVKYDAGDLGYFRKKIKVYFSGQRKAEVLYLEGWTVKVD
jgi:hypothetical protein